MAKTKADVRDLYLNYIDEATKKGVDLPIIKNADYRAKFDTFLDSAQKYIAGLIKIPAVFTVTQNAIPNMLGLFAGFDMVQVLPGTPKEFTFTGCKSAYFEMDNIGVATISVNGSVVQTINNTVKNAFIAYQVLTGATSSDTVKITFTATYPFNIRNTGFYEYAFPTTVDIPVYAPYVTYDMPSNFMSFDIPIIKSDPRVYEAYSSYKWENNKKIVLNYYDKGSFDIHYFKYPSDIAKTALDTVQLEVEEKAIPSVALWTAVLATATDNTALSSWLRSIFAEQIQNVVGVEMPNELSVQTVYSML